VLINFIGKLMFSGSLLFGINTIKVLFLILLVRKGLSGGKTSLGCMSSIGVWLFAPHPWEIQLPFGKILSVDPAD
jgi:hypothetical protein